MTQSLPTIAQLLEVRIQTLALTLRPSTMNGYRSVSRCFLRYLAAAFPHLKHVSQLQRDPHLLGWFRSQCDLSSKTRHTYLLSLRRLFDDLVRDGHPLLPELIRHEDFPLQPQYLPKPLSSSDDQLLQEELRRTDDLAANGLLLTRATGIRIGECIDLASDCLWAAGEQQSLLHVPLGKLRTERLVPAGREVQQIITRILTLRSSIPPPGPDRENMLLPLGSTHDACYQILAAALSAAAQRAGCGSHITPHRLRHSFASEMIRAGVSLPALMQMLGHKDIRMTLRYVGVTQTDLQREYHAARQNAVQPYRLPFLPVPKSLTEADPTAIGYALSTASHLLKLYCRQLNDEKQTRRLRKIDARLGALAEQLKKFATAEK
jgi:site-specific recombinase XerD